MLLQVMMTKKDNTTHFSIVIHVTFYSSEEISMKNTKNLMNTKKLKITKNLKDIKKI